MLNTANSAPQAWPRYDYNLEEMADADADDITPTNTPRYRHRHIRIIPHTSEYVESISRYSQRRQDRETLLAEALREGQ